MRYEAECYLRYLRQLVEDIESDKGVIEKVVEIAKESREGREQWAIVTFTNEEPMMVPFDAQVIRRIE